MGDIWLNVALPSMDISSNIHTSIANPNAFYLGITDAIMNPEKTEFSCGCWVFKPVSGSQYTAYHMCAIHVKQIPGKMPDETAERMLALLNEQPPS